jgi:hypothetical protein
VKRLALFAALIAVSLAVLTALILPPRAIPPVPTNMALTWPVVRGAFHVHSQRSDGTGTLEEIAAAASRAGLQFVIVTDHGDGTRAPEAPIYRSGVLCLDGVEISTRVGHYIAVGLPQTPYRLAGDARDVVEDVRRFGGVGFVAHPGSPKTALQWRDWDAPIDGLEWLNADSEWRDEFWGSLGGVLLTYLIRPVETLGGLLDHPRDVLAQWDRGTLERRIVAVAGADAHARLGYRQSTDPYEDRVLARFPGYEVSFRAFINHVILGTPFTGDAAVDAAALIAAIRDGHLFTSIESFAQLRAFETKARSGNAAAIPGAYLDVTLPVAIEAAIAAPEGTTLALLRNGELVYETREAAMRVDVGREAGAYRIEARLPFQTGRSAVPWLLTNPMYVGLRERHRLAADRAGLPAATMRAPIATQLWAAEASEGSTSQLRAVAFADGTPALEWAYRLAGAERSQFAAVRFPVSGGLTAYDRVQLRVRAERPHRIWAQLRTAGGAGERWGKSFHVGPELEQRELPLADFQPFESSSRERPPLDRVDSLLLVIDTVNTAPGSSGRVAFTDLWFAR